LFDASQGFRGTIELLDHQRYVMNGEIAEISETKLEITELPVRTWTQTYKEQVGCHSFRSLKQMYLVDQS
jgi:hypothetical protein